MKDLKYIIKRILIGVGIILVLSFIRGNKVYALETVNISWLNDTPVHVSSDSTYQVLSSATDSNGNTASVYRNRDTGYYAICFTGKNNCEVFNPSQYFTFTNVGIINDIGGSSNVVGLFFTNNGNLPTMNSGSTFRANFQVETFEIKLNELTNTILTYSTILQPGENGQGFSGYRTYYSYNSNVPWTPYNGKTSTVIEFLPPSASTIISLNPVKFKTASDVIFRYFFSPEFSNFNTNNFIYQYKFGNGSAWLNLNENNQLLQVNNNGTIYVRVKDKNTDEVVDSQTYTITDIGTFATNQDYNITFSGEYRTENYLNDNISSRSQSIIHEYQIYVDYTPKASILKYQYQYVIEGASLDSNNWQQVASSDNGSFTYVASQNGTLYARILDSSDNVLKTATFTVNNIGLLAFDSNEKGIDNFLTKLSNKINYGGPVSSLFSVPINFLNSLYSPISNSDSCSSLQLGNLLGTNLSLPCVNVKRYLGNNVYNIIDLIISFFLILGIIRLSINIYNRFISMKDISS